MEKREVRKIVREEYGRVARAGSCGCGPGCCGAGSSADSVSLGVGYTPDDLRSVPEGANLGLGCGNPIALASLVEGETVLDLGSGAGFDCFLAAQRVGSSGRVIGVDMTPDMLERARGNARKAGVGNVEFRLGEIEHLPVADASVDVVISNCVINLSPDKQQVFAEAFRALRPGGRLMVSDIVVTRPLPEAICRSEALYSACLSGALLKDEYLGCIRDAGFEDILVVAEEGFPLEYFMDDPAAALSGGIRAAVEKGILSVKVSARKPA
jgi:arsenite methyltransferase